MATSLFRQVNPNRLAVHSASTPQTQGRPVCALNYITNDLGTIQNTTGSATSGTVRVQYQTLFPIVDISFVFQCWASQAGTPTAMFGEQTTAVGAVLGPITYSSIYLEYNGKSVPLYINGQVSAVTMNPGAMLVTDAYKVQIPAGATFFIRYFQSVPNTTFVPGTQAQWFATAFWQNLAPGAGGANITANTGTAGLTTGGTLYSQCMGAIGTPSAGINPVIVGLYGDSIMSGFNSTQNYMSAAVLACANNGLAFVRGSCGGDSAEVEQDDQLNRSRNIMFADCDAMLTNFGTNDIENNARTVAQVQGWLINLWTRYANAGTLIFQSTLVPRVSGTFTTVAGQTPLGSESKRQALNAWLRAPMSAGPGNSALYDSLGALTGVYDSAAQIETDLTNVTPNILSPNLGGRWYCGLANNTAYTNDGVHPNITGATLLIGAIPIAQLGHFQIVGTRNT
jgi:lysophospholipase L1-like esterase